MSKVVPTRSLPRHPYSYSTNMIIKLSDAISVIEKRLDKMEKKLKEKDSKE
tara:strand:+ start:162 stop:314 length:153 start_codon:yes stop_codon:yes gene_type:complete